MTTLLPLVALGVALMVFERVVPDRVLPTVKGWWPRAIALNAGQVGVVVLAGLTWDHLLQRASLFDLQSRLSFPAQVAVGYLTATFVYYWWHRARHQIELFWVLCHQLHHSPQRIEVITSFYKHPVELLFNSLISGATSYALLGLSIEAAAWVTSISALAEFFYHLNVRTPRWVGWFVQRPEMHRIHHERGRHFDNFADLPVWDLLFGTYRNPATFERPCGFRPEREARFLDMLRFRNVNGPRRPPT